MVMAEAKTPLQIRASEEVSERFKALTENMGLTQGAALEKILSAYDDIAWKASVPDRAKEAEELEGLMRRILAIYQNAVEMNKNSEDNIRELYRKQIELKDSQIEALREMIKEASVKDKVIKELQTELLKYQQDAAVKNDYINELKGKIEQQTEIIENAKKLTEQNDLLAKENAEYKAKMTDIEQTHKEELLNIKMKSQEEIQKIQENYSVAAANMLKKVDLLKDIENTLRESKALKPNQ